MTLQEIKKLNREEFEELEVSYNLPTGKKLTESLLLNDEQEAVIKDFISLCETRLIEGVVEKINEAEKLCNDDGLDKICNCHKALFDLKQFLTKEIK